MSHGASLECPNCGRNLVQGENYCYFCELDVDKMIKKRHSPEPASRNPNGRIYDSNNAKKAFFGSFFSIFRKSEKKKR